MTFADDLPEVLTVEEAARALRVHPASIRRMCRAGELGCVKILGRWRVPKAELLKLLQPVELAGGRKLSRERLNEFTRDEDTDEHPRRAAAHSGPVALRGDAPVRVRIIE